MTVTQFVAFCVSLLLISLLSGCSSNELDNQVIQQSFQQHASEYEALLELFRADMNSLNLSFVSAEIPTRKLCAQWNSKRKCNLNTESWGKYQYSLRQLGVQWIEVEYGDPFNRYYFVTYSEPILKDARLRGVVFSEETAPQVSKFHPKQEWRPIQNGWYSFLMIDH